MIHIICNSALEALPNSKSSAMRDLRVEVGAELALHSGPRVGQGGAVAVL
jgi:hypothetical protein